MASPPSCFRTATISISVLSAAWSFVFLSPLSFYLGWPLMGLLIHTTFSPICHQIPERCFYWLGYPLPICARCLGMFFGFTMGWLWIARPVRRSSSALPGRKWIWIALFLLAADISSPMVGLHIQDHWTRFLSGAFFGLIFAPYVYFALEEIQTWLIAKRQGVAST